jgi:predicted TIM-barrel fold metal-dependent hydrolase
MVIDIHTHAFHPKIAARAVAHLNAAYSLTCACAGTAEDLLQRAGRAGIDRAVVLCAATDAAQVIPANNYALRLHQEYGAQGLLAFGTWHPDFADWEGQLERLRAAGIKGLKLHPDFQGFWLNDKRLLPFLDAAQDDFVFVVHVGDARPPRQNPSCPYKMMEIIRQFPRLRVVCAHFGGYRMWEHSLKALIGKPVWIDTSSTTAFVPPEMLRLMLRSHPQEYILFGSDYPLYDPAQEQERLQSMGRLSDATLELYQNNAAKLLDIALK